MKHFIELSSDRIAIIIFDTPPNMNGVSAKIKGRYTDLNQLLYQTERMIAKLSYQIEQTPSDWPDWKKQHEGMQDDLNRENGLLDNYEGEHAQLGSTPVPLRLSLVDVTISPMFGRWDPQTDIRCSLSGSEWLKISATIAILEAETAAKTIPLSDACDMTPY